MEGGGSVKVHSVGPFILGRTLGYGATGKVKLAFHKETGLKIAVKIIKKSMLQQKPSMRRKVEREIAVLKLVDHPQILKMYDVYETSKYLFLVLELVEGGELFDYLVNRGSLEPSEAMIFFQQIIHGIDYIHSQHICHRDLKPENLLLDGNKKIKLIDFGMASVMKTGCFMTTSCGSPHYASPEVVMGNNYDGRCADVWSAGVILYALLTGKLPFDDDNIRTLLRKVKQGVFHMPPYLPRDVKDLLWKMLTINPLQRITIREIKEHPCFKSNASATQVNKCVELVDTSPPLTLTEIDDDIFNTLEALELGTVLELQQELLSPEHNQLRAFYRILQQKKEAPECDSIDSAPNPMLSRVSRRGRSHSIGFGEPSPFAPLHPKKPAPVTTVQDKDRESGHRDRSNSIGSKNVLPDIQRVPARSKDLGSSSSNTSSSSVSSSGPVSPLPAAVSSPSSVVDRQMKKMNISSKGKTIPGSPAKRSFWVKMFSKESNDKNQKPADYIIEAHCVIGEIQTKVERALKSCRVDILINNEQGFKCKFVNSEGSIVKFSIDIVKASQSEDYTYKLKFIRHSGLANVLEEICSTVDEIGL